MTKIERDNRALLLQFMLDHIGGTDLNPIKFVRNKDIDLEVEYENGTKQIVSLIITDSDE